MERKLGKYSRLLFKLFLLFQLYSYHQLEVDAVQPIHQEKSETCNKHHPNKTHFEEETEENLRTKRAARLIPVQYLL